jgi:hypothetical protein
MQQTIDGDKARAYVYSGDWVADCTRPGCNNTEHLFRSERPGGPRLKRADFFHCSHCGREAFVDWPGNMIEISQVLMQRPIPSTRNWYPHDHPVAVRFRIPHGQSVRDLIDESEENGVH